MAGLLSNQLASEFPNSKKSGTSRAAQHVNVTFQKIQEFSHWREKKINLLKQCQNIFFSCVFVWKDLMERKLQEVQPRQQVLPLLLTVTPCLNGIARGGHRANFFGKAAQHTV